MANGSLPGEFVPYNYFFGAHHRKAKVSNLFHANLCSFSLLVIVSRLIPLAMHFPGIKRNKYSSVVIDRRSGLYSCFKNYMEIYREINRSLKTFLLFFLSLSFYKQLHQSKMYLVTDIRFSSITILANSNIVSFSF